MGGEREELQSRNNQSQVWLMQMTNQRACRWGRKIWWRRITQWSQLENTTLSGWSDWMKNEYFSQIAIQHTTIKHIKLWFWYLVAFDIKYGFLLSQLVKNSRQITKWDSEEQIKFFISKKKSIGKLLYHCNCECVFKRAFWCSCTLCLHFSCYPIIFCTFTIPNIVM